MKFINELRKTSYLNFWRTLLSLAFIISFPFSTAVNNISYVLLLLISLILSIKKKTSVKLTKLNIISVLVVVYLILDIILSGGFIKDSETILRYLVLLSSTLIFFDDRKFLFLFKKVYLIIYGVFSIFIIYNLIEHYIEFDKFILHKSSVNVEQVLFFERLYFGLFSTIASIITCSIFKKHKTFKFGLLIYILLINFVIATRLAFILVSLIGLSQIIFEIKSVLSLKRIILFTFTFSLFLGLFSINDGFKKRFLLNSESYTDFILKFKINEPRYAIWKCTKTISLHNEKFNILYGYASNIELFDNLFQCYEEHVYIKEKREWFLRDKLNTHNQFIHIFLLHGLFGFLLIIVLLGILLAYKNDLNSLYLLTTIIMFGMIESFIFRQIGVYLIAICFGLLTENNKIAHK